MEKDLDINNVHQLTELLVLMRHEELGGSVDATDEVADAFDSLYDNVCIIAENGSPADIGFRVENKILADKIEDKLRQQTFDNIIKDFGDIIDLLKTYLADNDLKPLQDKFTEMLLKREERLGH